MGGKLSFEEFTKLNKRRCEADDGFRHQLGSWSLSDWMVATFGELGELANVVKKLNRVRDKIPGNEEGQDVLYAKAQDELADTFVYLDLLCHAFGWDLMELVTRKFRKTSAKIGFVE